MTCRVARLDKPPRYEAAPVMPPAETNPRAEPPPPETLGARAAAQPGRGTQPLQNA